MEAVRNYTSGNRSMIINVVYIVAMILLVYYIYKWWKSGDNLIADLLPTKIPANRPYHAIITDVEKPRLRIRTGGEYTISFWMYITSWEYRNGLPKCVFRISDETISAKTSAMAGTSSGSGNYLMVGVLYPNEPKMMIRTYTGESSSTDVTNTTIFDELMKGSTSIIGSLNNDMPQCDIQDIDLQRWVHTAVSVNGRIVDVYVDGKLARSCILPNIPKGNDSGLSVQTIQLGEMGGFEGWLSGVQFYAYAVTPDRIYSTYQAGPYSTANFLTYMAEKLGIKVTYTGAQGAKQTGSQMFA